MPYKVRRGLTRAEDPERAAEALALQLDHPGATSVVFCSARYDLDALGPALQARFRGPVIGCTTAGEITPDGYQDGSICGFSVPPNVAGVSLWPIREVSRRTTAEIGDVGRRVAQRAAADEAAHPERRRFGLLLVDGISGREEEVVGHLGAALPQIPIVGGSAGDDRRHARTHVLFEGRFEPDAALLALFDTTRDVAAFKCQSFEPTDRKVVITDADPDRRLVRRIDGRPAAEAYAHIVGCPVEALDEGLFSANPLMLRAGGRYYVRSIRRAHEDGSLSFYCAIDEGLVLTLARSLDMISNLQASLTNIWAEVRDPEIVIGFECIHRRLESERRGISDTMGRLMAEHRVIGFHSYGEQADALHINQTFTGVALGGPK